MKTEKVLSNFGGGNLVVDLDHTINSAARELVGPTNKEVSSHGV